MGLPRACSVAGWLCLRVMLSGGSDEIGPSIIEDKSWTIMSELTCRSKRSASAWWTERTDHPGGESCERAGCAGRFLAGLKLPLARVGLEAGPLSQWLHAGLMKAGYDAVLLETRHMKAALSAMIVKTDRRDARGIAQLLRMGWFRPVHNKSAPSQEVRALLVARKQLQTKMRDIELSLRGLLRGFGLKVGEISKGQYAGRVRTLVSGHAMLERIADAMLQARRRCGRSSPSYTAPCW